MCIEERSTTPVEGTTEEPTALPDHPDPRVQKVVEAETDSDAIDVAIDLFFDAATGAGGDDAVIDAAAAVSYGFAVRHGRVEETLRRATTAMADAIGVDLPPELLESIAGSGRLVDELPRG